MVKNPPCSTGNVSSVPGQGASKFPRALGQVNSSSSTREVRIPQRRPSTTKILKKKKKKSKISNLSFYLKKLEKKEQIKQKAGNKD